MKRPESPLERLWDRWPYGLTFAPLAAEWAIHGRPPAEARAWSIVAASGLLVGLLVSLLLKKSRDLDEVSVTDKLTGLYNSRYLRSELDRQVALAHRSRAPLAILFVDVDDLKSVNDRFGHIAGDAVLLNLAQGLLSKVRAGMDSCFRFGGDEFLVLCPQTDLETARAVADRVARLPEELGVRVTRGAGLSVAVAALRPDERPVDLLRRADRLLYTAKRAGKGRVRAERAPRSAAGRETEAPAFSCGGRRHSAA
jgi:diguanylate cyclase (GGDEF)-like protein